MSELERWATERRQRARYTFSRHGQVIAIEDCFSILVPSPTVSNDAENVIADLARWPGLLDGKRVIYRDSVGRWDEIVVRDRQFAGFRLIGAWSRDHAIEILGRTPNA